jgi:hypothetical protein
MRVDSMCDKCQCIDWEIGAAQRLQRGADDPLTLSRLAQVIENLKAEKAALHPQAATENDAP